MLPFLGLQTPFPPTHTAQDDQGGLLAIGGGLHPERLIDAYRRGIFPWGTYEDEPVWYAPQPRMVLFPAELKISRSLRKTLRRGDYEVSVNRDFAAVIAACAATPREGQNGTWICPLMQAAYRRIHADGWAHSVEVRMGGELAGGLYGLAIGRAFFGESMFSWRTDASKIAFAHLCRLLLDEGVEMIDCQMHTAHLESLGGRLLSRTAFEAWLVRLIAPFAPPAQKRTLARSPLVYSW